jgi:hypothetical protein
LIFDRLESTRSVRTGGSGAPTPDSYADELVRDFLAKERRYINELEELEQVLEQMERNELLSHEQTRRVAAPLMKIMESAFRFLLGAEMSLLQPPDSPQWTDPFWNLSRDSTLYSNFVETEMEVRDILRGDVQGRRLNLSKHNCALLEQFLTRLSMPRARLQYYATFVTVCSISQRIGE